MLTVDRLELVETLLINLVILRTALSKHRNINLVVLKKLPFFRGVCYFGRKALGCWADRAVRSQLLPRLSLSARGSIIPLSGNDV
jgi:hypothetical protein